MASSGTLIESPMFGFLFDTSLHGHSTMGVQSSEQHRRQLATLHRDSKLQSGRHSWRSIATEQSLADRSRMDFRRRRSLLLVVCDCSVRQTSAGIEMSMETL